MAQVDIVIYKWEGKWGPFKIKEKCGECSLSLRIIKDVIKEFEDKPITFTEKPWLDNWHKPIKKGGWHAPIVLVNGKLLSQGIVVSRDRLRARIVEELYKDYAPEKGVHVFTLPDCKHCKRAKDLLKKKKIKFVEHNVLGKSEEMQKLLALVLGKIHPISLPQIFINGEWVRGADDLYAKEARGELDSLLRAN